VLHYLHILQLVSQVKWPHVRRLIRLFWHSGRENEILLTENTTDNVVIQYVYTRMSVLPKKRPMPNDQWPMTNANKQPRILRQPFAVFWGKNLRKFRDVLSRRRGCNLPCWVTDRLLTIWVSTSYHFYSQSAYLAWFIAWKWHIAWIISAHRDQCCVLEILRDVGTWVIQSTSSRSRSVVTSSALELEHPGFTTGPGPKWRKRLRTHCFGPLRADNTFLKPTNVHNFVLLSITWSAVPQRSNSKTVYLSQRNH